MFKIRSDQLSGFQTTILIEVCDFLLGPPTLQTKPNRKIGKITVTNIAKKVISLFIHFAKLVYVRKGVCM